MNKQKIFIVLMCMVCFFHKAYCPYTNPDQQIIDQLTTLKRQLLQLNDILQEATPELPVQKKISDFFTSLDINQIPAGLLYELYTRSNIIPSKSLEELNIVALTDREKLAYRPMLRDFSDLVQEIDQSPHQSNLLTGLRDQLENLLLQVSPQEAGQKHKKLRAKVENLIEAINSARYPTEIFRKILESLRVLPILPEREEPLELSEADKQNEKGLLAKHAAIIRSIQKKADKDQMRKEYIQQLKIAYSKMNAPEEERPLPPLPAEPEEIEERPLPSIPEEELPELPEQKEEVGTIPSPPPLPENKEQREKEEVRKSFEEQLKERAEELKKVEQKNPEERAKKESEWEDILKKALEGRRGSIEPEEEQEEPEETEEEQAEWEYNPWE